MDSNNHFNVKLVILYIRVLELNSQLTSSILNTAPYKYIGANLALSRHFPISLPFLMHFKFLDLTTLKLIEKQITKKKKNQDLKYENTETNDKYRIVKYIV